MNHYSVLPSQGIWRKCIITRSQKLLLYPFHLQSLMNTNTLHDENCGNFNPMKHTYLTRRSFIRMGAAGAAWFAVGGLPSLARSAYAGTGQGPYASLGNIGPLQPPDVNGMMLPPGFRSRVVARSGAKPVASSDYVWHSAPDGGATFATDDGGWIYVSNSEMPSGLGGVGALRFDNRGELADAYGILTNTSLNCAGGRTPWNSWLSCEEHDRGQVYECDPFGKRPAMLRPALGTFKHEAVAVDPVNQYLYLTEDKPDGGFYRFRPDNPPPDLTTGTLEIARVVERKRRSIIDWLPVPDSLAQSVDTRLQVDGYTRFDGGEGVAFNDGRVYFTTKGNNRVWSYDMMSGELDVVYDHATSENPILSGVDNVAITPSGDVLVAEDGSDMQIVVLTPSGRVVPLVQIIGHERSEITGPAFDPYFQRLYFSSQRGALNLHEAGITYEVTGPGIPLSG
jgi:hypothetical protein